MDAVAQREALVGVVGDSGGPARRGRSRRWMTQRLPSGCADRGGPTSVARDVMQVRVRQLAKKLVHAEVGFRRGAPEVLELIAKLFKESSV